MAKANNPSTSAKVLRYLADGPMIGLLCMILIIAAHLTYINNGFIWLDHGDIENNRAIIPLSRWYIAFVSPFAATGFYRPLVTLLHSFDAALWHAWAPGYHCTNIALHCAAAFAAPLFLGCFLPLSRRERQATTFVFGLHPLGILTAGGISFRGESLLSLFIFLSVWSYVKARSSNNRGWLILLFLFTLGAAFSKETAFFYLPVFLFLYEGCRAALFSTRKTGTSSAVLPIQSMPKRTASLTSKALPPVAVAASGLGFVFLLRQQALPTFWRIAQVHLPLQENVATRLTVLGKHIVNLVSPLQPTFSDAVSIVGMGNPLAITVAGALCAVIVFAIRRRLSVSVYALLLMIAICLLPALSILPLIRFYSPHYAYIAVAPVAGIALLLIRSVRKGGFTRQCIIYGACLVWGISATLSTAMAGTRFKSDLTFFAPEVRKDSRFLEAWFYLGNYYGTNNLPDQAWKAYDAALAAHPGVLAFSDKPEILINQSSVAFRGNDLDAADSLLRIAQTCASQSLLPFIAGNRAIIAGRRGDWDSVIAFLAGKEECLRRPEPCLLLAEALRNRGREREAKEMERRSLESGAIAPRFHYSQAR